MGAAAALAGHSRLPSDRSALLRHQWSDAGLPLVQLTGPNDPS
jgi:hypothetical protein